MLQSYTRSIIYIFIVTVLGIDYIRQHIEEPSLQLADANWSSSSDGDDFSSALQSSQAQDGAKQLDGYLACSADYMDLLKSFPAGCKLSVKLHTPLPAPAACERLFSITGLVLSPRRATLKTNFFWRWTDTFSVSVNDFMPVERHAVCPYNTQGGWERELVTIDDGRSKIFNVEKVRASFSWDVMLSL